MPTTRQKFERILKLIQEIYVYQNKLEEETKLSKIKPNMPLVFTSYDSYEDVENNMNEQQQRIIQLQRKLQTAHDELREYNPLEGVYEIAGEKFSLRRTDNGIEIKKSK